MGRRSDDFYGGKYIRLGIVLTPGFWQSMVLSLVERTDSAEMLPETLDFLEAFAFGGERFLFFFVTSPLSMLIFKLDGRLSAPKLILVSARRRRRRHAGVRRSRTPGETCSK